MLLVVSFNSPLTTYHVLMMFVVAVCRHSKNNTMTQDILHLLFVTMLILSMPLSKHARGATTSPINSAEESPATSSFLNNPSSAPLVNIGTYDMDSDPVNTLLAMAMQDAPTSITTGIYSLPLPDRKTCGGLDESTNDGQKEYCYSYCGRSSNLDDEFPWCPTKAAPGPTNSLP